MTRRARFVCAACGDPVLWAETSQGKRMPIDPWIDPLGNVATRLVAGTLIVRVVKPADPTRAGESRRVAHFATCKKYRRPAKPQPAKPYSQPTLLEQPDA